MSLTKDGFYKQIDGTIGDNTYLLLAGGGHIKNGNANGNVPLNNGVKNTNLYADILDGYHASDLLQSVTLGKISSSNNTLTQENTYIKVGGKELGTGSSTATIINSLSISKLSSDNTTNLTAGITINGKASVDATITNMYARYVGVQYCRGGSSASNSGVWSKIKNGKTNPTTSLAQFWTVYTDGGPTDYGEVLEILSANSNHWQPQLWFGAGKSGHLYYRNKDYNDDSWGSWRTILDSGNYTDYTVTKGGEGATGTWGISITGNASTATKLLTARSIWGQSFDGSGNVNGNIYIDTGNNDRFIQFRYNTNNYAGASWRLISRGSGSEDTKYFDIETGGSNSSANTWYRVIRLTMDNHNVGIGTDSPSYKLHVNGTFYASGNSSIDGTLSLNGTPDQSTPPLQLCYSTSFSASDSTIGLMKFGHPTDHDAYFGIAPASRTYFGNDAYFFHISYSKEFDWMSSGWEKLMALEASSGNLWVKGSVTANEFIGNATSATTCSYPAGFTSRGNTDWSGVAGTLATDWSVNGADIMFKYDGSKLNVITDGKFYQGIDIYGSSKRVLDEYDISHTKWGDADTLDGYHANDLRIPIVDLRIYS